MEGPPYPVQTGAWPETCDKHSGLFHKEGKWGTERYMLYVTQSTRYTISAFGKRTALEKKALGPISLIDKVKGPERKRRCWEGKDKEGEPLRH